MPVVRKVANLFAQLALGCGERIRVRAPIHQPGGNLPQVAVHRRPSLLDQRHLQLVAHPTAHRHHRDGILMLDDLEALRAAERLWLELLAHPDERAWIDDPGFRLFRHPPAPLCHVHRPPAPERSEHSTITRPRKAVARGAAYGAGADVATGRGSPDYLPNASAISSSRASQRPISVLLSSMRPSRQRRIASASGTQSSVAISLGSGVWSPAAGRSSVAR